MEIITQITEPSGKKFADFGFKLIDAINAT